MEDIVRILIADDRPRSRKGLAALLSINDRIEVIGEARDGREALEFVEEFQPDVVLMDAKMPRMDGIQATSEIKQRWPDVRVIVLSMYNAYRLEAEEVGADRFLEKGCQFWQQRVRELFENLDRPSRQKASSMSAEMLTLRSDREQHEFS
jgi:YesN/AraC family two-component response regulator